MYHISAGNKTLDTFQGIYSTASPSVFVILFKNRITIQENFSSSHVDQGNYKDVTTISLYHGINKGILCKKLFPTSFLLLVY